MLWASHYCDEAERKDTDTSLWCFRAGYALTGRTLLLHLHVPGSIVHAKSSKADFCSSNLKRVGRTG